MNYRTFIKKFKPLISYYTKSSNIKYVDKRELYLDLLSTSWIAFQNAKARKIKDYNQLKYYVSRAIKNRICSIYEFRKEIQIELRFQYGDLNIAGVNRKSLPVLYTKPTLKLMDNSFFDNYAVEHQGFEEVDMLDYLEVKSKRNLSKININKFFRLNQAELVDNWKSYDSI